MSEELDNKEENALATEVDETAIANVEDSKTNELEDPNIKLIAELNAEVQQLHDKLLRAMAESENVRRRYEKMVEDAREYSIVGFVRDLLGVMDNLSRALAYIPQNPDSQVTSILDGINMTKSELVTVFKKHGLEAIEPSPGEKFDYNLHHAISQIVTDEFNQDSIVSLMQVGYKMKDRLLRPAAVTVAKKADQQ
jgi:molecular chaperone GrpE